MRKLIILLGLMLVLISFSIYAADNYTTYGHAYDLDQISGGTTYTRYMKISINATAPTRKIEYMTMDSGHDPTKCYIANYTTKEIIANVSTVGTLCNVSHLNIYYSAGDNMLLGSGSDGAAYTLHSEAGLGLPVNTNPVSWFQWARRVDPNGWGEDTDRIYGLESFTMVEVSGASPDPLITTEPTYEPPTPANASILLVNATINCSHTSDDSAFTYDLYFDNKEYFYNTTQTGNNFFLWTTNISEEKTYYYNCSVRNNTNGVSSNNVTRYFSLDLFHEFNITAYDNNTGLPISDFNATILGTTYQTTTGNLTISISRAINITDVLIESQNYRQHTYADYNISNVLNADLSPLFSLAQQPTYNNYITYAGQNYTRTINYSVSVLCTNLSSTTYLNLVINGFTEDITTLNCTNETQLINETFTYGYDENYTISFFLNTTYQPTTFNNNTFNNTFLNDATNPIAFVNYTVDFTGFNTSSTNLTLRCTDNITPLLTYNKTFNGDNFFYDNLTSGTNQTNVTTLNHGFNNLTGVCWDFFGSSEATISNEIYVNVFVLIDEKENILFDVRNLSSARLYYDDNSTFFDFKLTNASSVNFTSFNNNKLRFEFVYSAGTIITRYIDVTLLTEEIRVCANKDGITHFEQIILSGVERPTILKNVFSDCIVAADYTRFAYQDSLILKAFTIESLYSLYTFNRQGLQTFLASVDGSIAAFLNLDFLEFTTTGFSFSIFRDALNFEKTDTHQIKIFYQNIAQDNTALTTTISNSNTSAIYFTSSDFIDPNTFTIYFDYSTIPGITNETLFKITLDKTTSSGTSSFNRYFNTQAQSGIIRSQVAFLISMLITIFGLTITIPRLSFSWLGIFVLLGAIIFLSFSVVTWYTILLTAIESIMLVYIVIILNIQTYPTLAG